jgi:hypothetical protein
MFEKYITIKESKIVCGQTSSGTWYCKELPADSTKEMECLIGEVNRILNRFNKHNTSPPPPKKTNKVRM